MNFVPVISHAFAILLGWLVVAFATLPHPAAGPAADAGPDDPRWTLRAAKRHTHGSPGALLSAQADMAMDPAARTALKKRILSDWARTDPDGLLRYLDQRPWLAGSQNAATKALSTLAHTRPDDLLDYAKREGCRLALATLYRDGDPRVVLESLLNLPPGYYSSEAFAGLLGELFERGCEMDLSFHRRLAAIDDPATRLAVFEDVAATLLANKRHEDLFAWINDGRNPDAGEKLLDTLAAQLVAQRADPACLQALPDHLRNAAVGATLRVMAEGSIVGDEHYQVSCLSTFLENGWLARHRDTAANVISEYYDGVPDGLGRDDAIAWKNWVLALPADPKWNSLRRTAIRRWALEDPRQWRTIAELPGEDLRNAAYAALAHSFDLRHDSEHIAWILGQITDPNLRLVAIEVASARLASDGDPFAGSDIDPFHPLAAR